MSLSIIDIHISKNTLIDINIDIDIFKNDLSIFCDRVSIDIFKHIVREFKIDFSPHRIPLKKASLSENAIKEHERVLFQPFHL